MTYNMNSAPKDLQCFGDLNTVFPMQTDGLRATPEPCMRCKQKTQCLRAAMDSKKGLHVREEMIDRAYRGGIMGFFQRWSQKKGIHQQKK